MITDQRPADTCRSSEASSWEADRALAQRMAAGDREALADVYRAHGHDVHTALRRLVGDDAEDVAHEAFVRAFERAHQFQGGSSLGTWIHRIARNLAFSRLRRGRRIRPLAGGSRVTQPRATVQLPTIRVTLEKAINELSPKLRAVLVLHTLEGFTHADIAERLGITEAASRSRLHRARSSLARRLSMPWVEV